jgi:hypothetical protein
MVAMGYPPPALELAAGGRSQGRPRAACPQPHPALAFSPPILVGQLVGF